MSDMLEELLTDLRESAVREIRPPGAEAARRTVRRRRVTKAAASACAVLVAVGGAFVLVDRPGTEKTPAAISPSPSIGSEQFAADALAGITDAGAGFDVAAPVAAGYRRTESMVMPRLVLRAACVGAGQITLVVTGDVTGDLGNRFEDVELARVPLSCGAAPAPVTRKINASLANVLTFRLESAGSAAGRAGFAYRVTAEGGASLAPNDIAASVAALVGLDDAGNTRFGGGAPENEPFDGSFHIESGKAEFPAGERYILAMACRGKGTYGLQIRRGGKVLAEHSVECSWPPRRREFVIEKPLGKNVEFWGRYRAGAGERAETGWALHIR
ncbi:hypothetical protein [Actinoplanes aureus]|uniref:Uncharacterized protein n=1 Tax=Actinoplanes aureus TaxID=2792083 RepID=A0A931CD43_9ACTN|nr:hypothetical protein [Actinoplanes aureus]MBG0567894.1 hypothetical protein [Actinoplanes aureus]